MFILEFIVNNSDQIYLTFDDQVSVEQMKDQIIQTLRFPKQSAYTIEIDQIIRDPSYILSTQPKSPIRANFHFETVITIFDTFNTMFKYRLDLCKSILEIQKDIRRHILPIEYCVYIVQSNENINNLYLNSYDEIPKQLEFLIQTSFYINFQGIHHQFKIHPFEINENIKHEILAQFNIQQEIYLIYNETELSDHQQYITYLIPDHSELKIKFQTRIKYFVKYQDNIHQYSASLNEKLGIIKQKLRQIYQIPEKYQFQLTYLNNLMKNDQESMQNLRIQENSIIEMNVGNKYQLTLQDKDSSQKVYCEVRSIDLVSILDKQTQFINKQVTYEFNGQQLKKTESFEQITIDTENLTIYYQIEKQSINVYFQEDNDKQHKFTVVIQDKIKLALSQLNQLNDPITIFYGEKNISIDSTYEQEGIVNESIIVYKINDKFQIKYTIAPNFQEHIFQVSRKTSGAKLLQSLSQIHQNQGNQYKLMFKNTEFPSDQIVTENQLFRLVRTFEMKFYYTNDNQVYYERFSQEDKILDVRQKFSQKFNLSLNSIILEYKDLQLKDDLLIHQYKERQLFIYEIIHVYFQKRNSPIKTPKQYKKTLQVKEVLRDFLKEYGPTTCRFELNKQPLDENKLIKEYCKEQQQILLIFEFEYNLRLINKEQQREVYKVQFYQKDIIGYIFSKYLSDNFQCYYQNQLINTEKSFEDQKIQNNSLIYYQKVYNFTLENLNDKSNVKIQINSLNTIIIDAIQPKIMESHPENFTVFYNNREIDVQKSFLQEKIINGTIIQYQLHKELTVIVHDNDLQKKYKADPNSNIGQLIKLLKGKENKKLFNSIEQKQLEDNIVLSTLKNYANIVELIYKEVVPNADIIYQPSEQISNFITQTQNMKTTDNSQLEIVIFNMMNDEKIFETVKLDQKIGEFLQDFQIKMEFSDISLFFEGALADYNKTFEEIGAKSLSLFEII